jgi:hypothetical protein
MSIPAGDIADTSSQKNQSFLAIHIFGTLAMFGPQYPLKPGLDGRPLPDDARQYDESLELYPIFIAD